ncbi:hypothetical protein KOW79_016021 [Hemibagrus wyckioides]|uniref:Uncharacterized protein n=1 Tax=Hemibagrus wyckioides TaxID=337641 RepID=A0A9D3NC23_9TELE|nr:hypothetical protein KOW79_016021 [Hemibagrus wyckioides]
MDSEEDGRSLLRGDVTRRQQQQRRRAALGPGQGSGTGTDAKLVLGTIRREVMPPFNPFRKKPMTEDTEQHP